MRTRHFESIWVDGTGATVPANDAALFRSIDERIDAVDRRGWINLRAGTDSVELWINPLNAGSRTVCAAIEILRRARSERRFVVRVYDRGACGALVADSIEQLPELIHESVGLTSRPGFPLMQDRLAGCLPTDINDHQVQEMWRFLVATRFSPGDQLVDRVVDTPGRAKIVSVGPGGKVRYLAHDRQTSALWKRPDGFAGESIDEIPMPTPLKRSVRADLAALLEGPQIVVSFVRGLRRVMRDEAPMDSYFRISIPLSRHPRSPERSALVLLAPYG